MIFCSRLKQRKCDKNIFCFIFLFNYFFILCQSNHSAGQRIVAKSCRDHYFSGHLESGVFPLQDLAVSHSKVFRVECEFPTNNSQSTVGTLVHNGLEKLFVLNSTDKKTVRYQISEWPFLRSIIANSEDCLQELYVKWHTESLTHQSTPMFSIESLSGEQRIFQQNNSFKDNGFETFRLEGKDAGVLHIFPTIQSKGVSIRSSPLKCRQIIVQRKDCLFDLISAADSLWIDVETAVKIADTEVETVTFSFRTDRPTQSFFNIRTHLGNSIQVDLIDGYLITVNHIIHPIGLLTDGNWHSATINLKTLVLKIDENEGSTGISLRSSALNSLSEKEDYTTMIVDLTVLLTSAQITAVRLSPMNAWTTSISKFKSNTKEKNDGVGQQNDETTVNAEYSWICRYSKLVYLKHNFSDRSRQTQSNTPLEKKICSSFQTAKNFCNCMGPNSALLTQVGGHYPAACSIQDGAKALKLRRASNRLSFFYIPNFYPKSAVSVVFRSDLDNGLLIFGNWGHLNQFSAMPNAPTEKSSRIQVHFVGKTMTAVFCLRLMDDSERCYSCSIVRPKGYASSEWLRMSLFFYEVYYFMSINEQICKLSPNSLVPDSSELYKVSSTVRNVLLVGGMYYTKHAQLNRRVNDTMRRELHDNTREKPLSFQGCVAEVRIAGVVQNLSHLLQKQIILFAKTVENQNPIFAIEESGCQENCSAICGKIPCKFTNSNNENFQWNENNYVCDCNSAYDLHDLHDNRQCARKNLFNNDNFGLEEKKPYGVILTSPKHLTLNNALTSWQTEDDNRFLPRHSVQKSLHKIWFLLRFPTSNEDLHTLLELGPIEIQVGSKGKHIVVNIEQYEVQEEFYLPHFNADERLHLLAIEQNPSIGTATDSKSINIRLDNEIRTVYGIAQIPFYPINDQWQIVPVNSASDNNDAEDSFTDFSASLATMGCLAEFALSFAPLDENSLSNKPHQQKSNDVVMETDYLALIVDDIIKIKDFQRGFEKQKLLVEKTVCGTLDPQIWIGNSSSWGTLSDYDPKGTSLDTYGGVTSLISLTLTFLLIVILLFLICCYCYYRLQCDKQKVKRRTNFKCNITKKGSSIIDGTFDKFSINSVEKKRLLKENFNVNSSRTSFTTRSPTQNNETTENSNKTSPDSREIHGSALKLAENLTPNSNYVLVQDNTKPSYYLSDSFVIDDYSSSPKLAGRRHRSKATILLRRPPDPPQIPLSITPIDFTNNNLAGPLFTSAVSPSSKSSGSTSITAPIARQEELE